MTERSFDVVVVGGGSAGAAAACFLAQRGWRVVVVERRQADRAGARWVNGVPAWAFDRAGVHAPTPPERLGAAGIAHGYVVTVPGVAASLRLPDSPVVDVDMRRLVARLRESGAHAGVEFIHGRVAALELLDGRPDAVIVEPSAPGPRLCMRARLVVDASGLAGAVRRRIPELVRLCPDPGRGDLCSASQFQHAVADPEAGRHFLERHGARPGESLALTAVAGGFSVLTLFTTRAMDQVGVLTGSIPALGHPTGARLHHEFVETNPWIGAPLFGGHGAIPLRRPYTTLVAPGVALIGDAASQVYGAHGSGVAMGLVAARMLADAVGSHGDPGDPTRLHARYAAPFHREYGGLLAGSDVFRRFSQSLTQQDVASLLGSGLLSLDVMAAALGQRPPRPTRRSAAQAARGAVRAPRLAARLGPAIARIAALHHLYGVYPELPDGVALARFEATVRRVSG